MKYENNQLKINIQWQFALWFVIIVCLFSLVIHYIHKTVHHYECLPGETFWKCVQSLPHFSFSFFRFSFFFAFQPNLSDVITFWYDNKNQDVTKSRLSFRYSAPPACCSSPRLTRSETEISYCSKQQRGRHKYSIQVCRLCIWWPDLYSRFCRTLDIWDKCLPLLWAEYNAKSYITFTFLRPDELGLELRGEQIQAAQDTKHKNHSSLLHLHPLDLSFCLRARLSSSWSAFSRSLPVTVSLPHTHTHTHTCVQTIVHVFPG